MAELLASLRAAIADRYTIERELGRGGMATVYLAQDLKHHRRVAIKVLRPELAAALGPERFLREIEIAGGLQHPHMLTLIDSGSNGGFLYYVMPYVEGESLRARLVREKQLPIEDALQIAHEVADALSYAHSRGVLHRDIKPENILLSGGHAIVADFGIARAVSAAGEERLTQTGVPVGTPAYMSPEQATGSGQLDGRSDIYSLGCVVYEMLAGSPPFAGTTAQAILARQIGDPLPPLRTVRKTVSPTVVRALEKALAKVPADRFTSAIEFAEALRTSLPEPISWWNHRIRFILLSGLVTVFAVALGVELSRVFGPRRPGARNRPPSQLTSSGLAQGPVFAPDGKSVAYSEHLSSATALVVRDLNGGEATIFRDSGGAGDGVRWSPSGSRILFRDFPGRSLSTISHLGGERTRFLLNAGFLPEDADFGADDSSFVLGLRAHQVGQWLYVGRVPSSVRAVGMDSLEGDGLLIRLMPMAGDLFMSGIVSLRVSPDRRWAAVTLFHGLGSLEVMTVALDGSRQNVVVLDSTDESVNSSGVSQFPAWSAGSDWIYYATEEGSASRISRVQIDNESGRRKRGPELVLDRLPRNLAFDVSPEGRRLVYSGGPRRASPYLWTWAAAAGTTSQVSKLIRGTASYQSGRISPDGRLIAYLKADELGASGDLYVRSLREGAERLVVGRVSGPIDWSPDGRLLAYFRPGMGGGLTVVDVQSGRARQLATRYGSPSRLAWSPNGRLVAYASAGGLIILQDTAGGPDTQLPFMGSAPRLASFANPVFSPDGRSLALFRPSGLWVLDIASRRESVLMSGLILPKRWTRDGWIYVVRFDSTFRTLIGIERVPAAGGQSRLVAQAPPELQGCNYLSLVLTSDGNGAVCSVVERADDIWVIDLRP